MYSLEVLEGLKESTSWVGRSGRVSFYFYRGTELHRAVYIKLPADAGVNAGKVLLLKRSVSRLKTSGKDFIDQLGEEILGFSAESKCPQSRKVTKNAFKRIPVDDCVLKESQLIIAFSGTLKRAVKR